MQTTNFIAPDIECAGCANAIQRALGKVSGVETVTVEVATKRVAVTHQATVDEATLANALEKAGFPVQEK